MRVNKKLVICSVAAIILSIVAITLIILYNKEDSIDSEFKDANKMDIEYELMVMSVVDFEDNIATNKAEARYSVTERATKLYINGEYVKTISLTIGSDISLIEFQPELKLKDISYSNIDLGDYKSDIRHTYSMDIRTTEEYVVSLIKNEGYKLLRRVNAVSYCEAYLLDKDNNIIRIVATSDRMMMAPLKSNVGLREITNYFMESGGIGDEN
mgnify:CR=1 FL=1